MLFNLNSHTECQSTPKNILNPFYNESDNKNIQRTDKTKVFELAITKTDQNRELATYLFDSQNILLPEVCLVVGGNYLDFYTLDSCDFVDTTTFPLNYNQANIGRPEPQLRLNKSQFESLFKGVEFLNKKEVYLIYTSLDFYVRNFTVSSVAAVAMKNLTTIDFNINIYLTELK